MKITSGKQVLATASFAWASVLAMSVIGCGPEFDPPSLIERTRVVGAQVDVQGSPGRATPARGETADVTWLVTSPAATPPLGWAFALCKPAPSGALGCQDQPLSVYQGTTSPPRVAVAVPAGDALGTTKSLVLYGRICDNAAPVFDPQTGYPGCADGTAGTTASVTVRLQTADTDANHNPNADRGFTFDAQPWPAPVAGADPCVAGPKVAASADDHIITITTDGTDREAYTALVGDPPVPTMERESLQISQFATAGKFKSPYSFAEAADNNAQTITEAKWKTPEVKKVTAPTPVTFTFVTRDDRGGINWTTRTACVTP